MHRNQNVAEGQSPVPSTIVVETNGSQTLVVWRSEAGRYDPAQIVYAHRYRRGQQQMLADDLRLIKASKPVPTWFGETSQDWPSLWERALSTVKEFV